MPTYQRFEPEKIVLAGDKVFPRNPGSRELNEKILRDGHVEAVDLDASARVVHGIIRDRRTLETSLNEQGCILGSDSGRPARKP